MRYDFGGGCREYAYDEEITIVDITPMENCENVSSEGCDFGPPKKCKSDKYIVADIFSKDLILPEKADFINASQVLRYFAGQYNGYLDSNSIDNDKLKIAAQNIINNLKPFGIIRLCDHMPVLEDIIQELLNKDFEMISCIMMNPRDLDYGAEWEIILR